MRSLMVVALTLTVLAAAGCSGDDDDPSTTIERTTTVVRTTEPDTTAAPTTDKPTTTNAPTTEAPATTVDPTAALIADIEADLNAGEQALLAAAAAPTSAESESLARRFFTGESLVNVLSTLRSLSEAGLVARPNPDLPNVIQVTTVDDVDEDATRATVRVCRVDAGAVVEMLPNGTEIIVDDSVNIYQSRSIVVQIDGLWILESGVPIDDAPAVLTCD